MKKPYRSLRNSTYSKSPSFSARDRSKRFKIKAHHFKPYSTLKDKVYPCSQGFAPRPYLYEAPQRTSIDLLYDREMSKIVVIVKKSLSEQIYELIKQDILGGHLAYGEKIINRELQEKYGVSSTPIRDAVNRLYQDGLIENITKVGARVISFDVNSALEINEIVSLLCASAVKLSAQSSDIKVVSAQLEKVVDLQKTHVQDDQFFEYDYKFHKTFFDFCNNSRLKALYKQYNMLTRLWTTFFHDQVAYREESVQQHREIFTTYQAGDVLEAQGLMEYHFAHAGELLKTQDARQSNG